MQPLTYLMQKYFRISKHASISVLLLALISLLTACPPTSETVPPSFSLSVTDSNFTMKPNSELEFDLSVVREGGLSTPISVFLEPQEGFSMPSMTFTEKLSQTSLLSTTAPVGVYTLSLKATSASLNDTLTLKVEVQEDTTSITAISLEGSTSKQVRQGAGPLVVRIEGQMLAEVSSFKIANFETELLEQSSSLVRLQVTVPHGAELGAKQLDYVYQGETISYEEALIITEIHVSPDGSNEASGTAQEPFRSLTKALSVAGSGDGVRLSSGTYGEGTEESWVNWPYEALPGFNLAESVEANVADGVSIRGEGENTILVGKGVGEKSIGLVLAGNNTISGLKFENFDYAIMSKQGESLIEQLNVSSSAAGLWLYGTANVALTGDSSFETLISGMAALNYARLNVLDSKLKGGLIGLTVTGNASVFLKNVQISEALTGLAISEEANVQLDNLQANQNTIGMDVSGGNIVLRNSSLSDNTDFGIRVTNDVLRLDLGTDSEAGNNVLQGNGKYQFLDARPERDAADGTIIEISDTLIQGDVNLTPNSYTGIYAPANKTLMIVFTNNRVVIH